VAIGPFREEEYDFVPAERSSFGGGPASPWQPRWRRPICATVGILTGLAGGLGNALISVNTSMLLGSLGLEANEIAWLPTVYSMTYLTMNLLLVRFRQQFGLRLFSILGLSFFCTVMLLHVFVSGFAGALAVHAAAGFAAAPLTSLSVYYLMSAFPPPKAMGGVIMGIGLTQVPTPLARLFSSDLLSLGQWQALYRFEFGLALTCLGCVLLVRLPPSKREPAFERLDFLTYPLMATGMALVCAVIGMGKSEWWFDRDWLGWAAAAAVPLLGAGLYIERNRARPLLDLSWLRTPDIIRFAVVAIVARIVLAEQSTSVIGMLAALGVNNDELRQFSLLLLASSVAGLLTATLLFRPARITGLAALAIALVALGAAMDAQSTNLTRVPELRFSQMLIAFASTLFIGPAMVFGITFVRTATTRPLPSFLVLFAVVQNLGSLIGSALLGTYQVIREKAASVVLAGQLSATNPQVASRIQGLSGSLSSSDPDGAARSARGVALLHQQMTREATMIAYDDTFRLVAIIAAATTAYLLFLILRHWRRDEPLSAAAVALGRPAA
jgi:MFS family permease